MNRLGYQPTCSGVEGKSWVSHRGYLDSVDPIIGLTTLGCLLIRPLRYNEFVDSIRLFGGLLKGQLDELFHQRKQ